MRLERLIQDLSPLYLHGELQRHVRGLAYHTGQVEKGSVFVAIRGTQSDGHNFLRQAIDRGARTVVVERPLEPIPGVTVVGVANTRTTLAQLSCRYYGFPSEHLTVIGITGTNGKTTTAYLLESILADCGYRVGVIGTVNVRYPGHARPAPVTTPESLDLQRTLNEMLEAGVTHVIAEISSHGLAMHRVDGTRFAVGLFTNLSQDHLDYHGSMDKYFAAKSRLFSQILQEQRGTPALAVINADDAWGQTLCSRVNGPLLRYGLGADAEIRAESVRCDFSGIRALICTPAGKLEVRCCLLGRLNLYNLLAAAGTAVGLGLPLEVIRTGQQRLTGVPGRLENIPNEMNFQVLVDYAHTPDALEKTLCSLRELDLRRILCVFGCGGDRDRRKRPLMGAAAARYADLLVVTSDNPRSEDPEAILAEIEAGLRFSGLPRLSSGDYGANFQRGYTVVVDRSEAIRLAINCAREGDLVYIGGKGHENYQIIGTRRIEFDDRFVARQALAERSQRTAGNSQ